MIQTIVRRLVRLTLSVTVFTSVGAQGQVIKVTLLGPGSPPPVMNRFGPSTLVEAGGQKFLFGAGRGCLQRLTQMKVHHYLQSQRPPDHIRAPSFRATVILPPPPTFLMRHRQSSRLNTEGQLKGREFIRNRACPPVALLTEQKLDCVTCGGIDRPRLRARRRSESPRLRT